MLKRFIATSCLLAFCAYACSSGTEVMPVFKVKTLSGVSMDIPEELPVGISVYIIGFSKNSREQTSEWSRSLKKRTVNKSINIYSVSVIEDVPFLVRSFVIKGIKKGVPENIHGQFFIATSKSLIWKDFSKYLKPNSAYIVVVCENNNVLLRFNGKVSEEKISHFNESVKTRRHCLKEQEQI